MENYLTLVENNRLTVTLYFHRAAVNVDKLPEIVLFTEKLKSGINLVVMKGDNL